MSPPSESLYTSVMEPPSASLSAINPSSPNSNSTDGEPDLATLLSDARLAQLAPHLHIDESQKNSLHAIRDIQIEHNAIFIEYMAAKQEIEDRYERKFAPMFSRRREQLEIAPIKLFWFKAFEHCEVLRENITDKDAVALQFLTDVSSETVTMNKDLTSKLDLPVGSFVLTFRFGDNPFFENDVLTKTYVMQEDDFEELEEARGTKILWKPGKDVTVRTMKKKSKNGRVLVRRVPTDSFFNFFSPPQGMMDEEGDVDDNLLEELEDVIDADFELGETIRADVIPRALLYYLNVAEADDEDEDDEEIDDEAEEANGQGGNRADDDDEDDDDDDDDENEDDDDDLNFRNRDMLPPPAQSAEECKQQ